MLRERSVARFLVAPDGFGKTQLALEYADVVFSFAHTFWFPSKSPCFLRDLDKGALADGVLARDAAAKLVVFDDVPRLDDVRADAFSRTVDALLARGVEVVVSLAPSCDAYASRQPDRVALFSSDLLLSDGELDGAAGESASRVPSIAWGGGKGGEAVVAGFVAEGLPSDELAIAFRMLAFAAGSVADAVPPGIPPARARDVVAELAARYPYFGIDDGRERFDAPEVSEEQLAKAFAPRLADLADAHGASDSDEVVCGIASELVRRGRPGRACRLVAAASSRPARETWLAEHDRQLVDRCCLEPASALYSSARPPRESEGGRLQACEALRRYVLGDRVGAYELAAPLGKSAVVAEEVRSFAAVVATAAAPDEACRADADRSLDRVALPRDVLFSDDPLSRVVLQPWRACATIVALARADAASACAAWVRAEEIGCDGAAAIAAAAGVAAHAAGAMAAGGERPALPSEAMPSLSRMARFLASFAQREVAESGRAGLWSVMAGDALEAVRALAPSFDDPGIEPAASAAVRIARADVFEQRLRASRQATGRRRRGCPPPSAERAKAGAVARVAAPTLRVELFGGMSVSIGGELVDESAFGRRKLKTLLALLVIEAGREVPRDRLAEAIWPNRPIDAARKNMYSLWSRLKRALSLPDGTCPYLVRMPNGYKLDDAALESDVRRVEEICRMLLFGRLDPDAWVEALSELGAISAGGFMPCETDNEAIAAKRREYHVRVVDALVGASRRLVDEGDAQAALWFARAAHEFERTREDVYCALMAAQISSGQRSAALATYFECKRFLADGLGIDPSTEIVDLYRSIIEEEAVLEW